MSGDRPPPRISSSSGATRCDCPPFSQAAMAALKLITSSDKPPLCISSDMAPHAATVHPSRKLRWLC
eukprot:5202135-Karenia_brevis.AAC.1